jgi:hypothetical protein
MSTIGNCVFQSNGRECSPSLNKVLEITERAVRTSSGISLFPSLGPAQGLQERLWWYFIYLFATVTFLLEDLSCHLHWTN